MCAQKIRNTKRKRCGSTPDSRSASSGLSIDTGFGALGRSFQAKKTTAVRCSRAIPSPRFELRFDGKKFGQFELIEVFLSSKFLLSDRPWLCFVVCLGTWKQRRAVERSVPGILGLRRELKRVGLKLWEIS